MEIALQIIIAVCAILTVLFIFINYMLKPIEQNQREIKAEFKEEFKEFKKQFETLVKNLSTQEIKTKKQ